MENQILDIITKAAISILGVLISYGVSVGIAYLSTKKQQVIAKIGADEFNQNRELALTLVRGIEQRFKGQTGVSEAKIVEFENLILKYIPTLTKDQITNLRDFAVKKIDDELQKTDLFGEAKVNQKSLQIPIVIDTTTSAELLKNEKEQLQSQLNQQITQTQQLQEQHDSEKQNLQSQLDQLTQQTQNLQTENEQLKTKLSQVQSVFVQDQQAQG